MRQHTAVNVFFFRAQLVLSLCVSLTSLSPILFQDYRKQVGETSFRSWSRKGVHISLLSTKHVSPGGTFVPCDEVKGSVPGSKAEAPRICTEGTKDARRKLETAKKAPFRKAWVGAKKRKTIHPIVLETKEKDVIAQEKTHARIWMSFCTRSQWL